MHDRADVTTPYKHFDILGKVRLQFFQSDVYWILYICSGVVKGHRGEDEALDMDRKVGGGGLWSVREVGSLQNRHAEKRLQTSW